ncbi:MAG: HNH endonuclease signature motif containing protein, partial [Anaeromyxobacteraceae bacterium]
PAAPRSRHINAAVRREVWIRDEGRCQFRLESGEVCGSTHRLQYDHVHPFALGGESSAANLKLACAAHNLLAARRVYGDELMDRFTRGASRPPAPDARQP